MKRHFLSFCGLLLTVSHAFFSFGQTPTPQPVPKPLNENAIIVRQDVAEALTVIQKNYGGSKTLDYNKVIKRSIISMLQTLDPHSYFLDPKETEEFNSRLSAQYFGIGFVMAPLPGGKENMPTTYVRAAFENSPANRAGLRYGDKIIEANGVSMLGKSIDDVRSYVLGPRGTAVKIVIERNGKRETFEIVRDAISLSSIPIAYMIRPGVGYIAMTGGFTATTYDEFKKAMAELKRQGMEYLVLDLRNNLGGLAKQARLVASAFLERGRTIYTQKGHAGQSQKFESENDSPDKTPIVALINRRSASSAEILSGALQDNDRALFIGETSYGKGLIQYTFDIENNSMLILTTARYETPSGRLIQRDYSNGNLYDHYSDAGNFKRETQTNNTKGQEYKTTSGRIIYGGGGITPDVVLKQPVLNTKLQNKLRDIILPFSFELVYAKIAGFEAYKIDRPIVFNYDLKATDFPVTDALYQAFRSFAVEKYKLPAAQIDSEREFVERSIRAELVTAAYGENTPLRVLNEYDDQLKKALELLPQAKQLVTNLQK